MNRSKRQPQTGGGTSTATFLSSSDDDEFSPGVSAAIEGFLNVILAGGNDEAFLIGIAVGQSIYLDAGSGSDAVEISAVTADSIFARMGAGSDDLVYFDNAADSEDLDGGANFDELFIDFTTGRRIRSFENVVLDNLIEA